MSLVVSRVPGCQRPPFSPERVHSFTRHYTSLVHNRLWLSANPINPPPRPLFGSVSTRTLYGSSRVDLSGLVTPTKKKIARDMAEAFDIPREALFHIFVKNIKTLEAENGLTFSLETQKWLWTAVAEEPLNSLKKTLISEIAKKILLGFTDADLGKMSGLQEEAELLKDKSWLAIKELLVINEISLAAIVVLKSFSLEDPLKNSMREALKRKAVLPTH